MARSSLFRHFTFALAFAFAFAFFFAAAADAVTSTSPSVSTSASEPSSIFDEPRLIELTKRHCLVNPYPAGMLHSDKMICDILKERDVEELEEYRECIICCQPICSKTLSTTACGHISHRKCRVETFKFSCHICRSLTAGDARMDRDTLFTQVLYILETIDARHLDYDMTTMIGRLKIRPLVGSSSPESSGRLRRILPDRLRRIFEDAKKTMDRCERNVVWRQGYPKFVRGIEPRQIKMEAIVKAMELGDRRPPRPEEKEEDEGDLRTRIRMIQHDLVETLLDALPKDSELDEEETFIWLARSVMFADFVRTSPCQGALPVVQVQMDWIEPYAAFLKALGLLKMEADPTYGEDAFGRIAKNLPKVVKDVDYFHRRHFKGYDSRDTLFGHLRAAIDYGRKFLNLLWDRKGLCGRTTGSSFFSFSSAPPPPPPDKEFRDERARRDEYVAEIRSYFPDFHLPLTIRDKARRQLAQTDTSTCETTVRDLRRLADLIFRALVKGIASDKFAGRNLQDWRQRLKGLTQLALDTTVVKFRLGLPDVRDARDGFTYYVKEAAWSMRTWMRVNTMDD